MKLLKVLLAFMLVLVVSVVVVAQTTGLNVPDFPEDLTVGSVITKVSTWAMVVLNLLLTYLSKYVPKLNATQKYFRAMGIAIALAVCFIKFGIAAVPDALIAFILGQVIYEARKKPKPIEISPSQPPTI